MLRAGVVQLTGDIAFPGLGGPSSALDGEAGFRSVRRPPCASQRPRIRGIEHHQLLSPSAASKPTAHEYRSVSCRLSLIHIVDDHLLEAAGVKPGSNAGVLAALHDRLADVVGKLSALSVLAAERPVARLALHQATQQVCASDLRGWDVLGARARISLPTRLNWALVMMAGNAFSTRTGSALSFAFTPQIRVPV